MKGLFKNAAVKVLSFIIIVALIMGAGYLGITFIKNKIIPQTETVTVTQVDVIREKLATAAELNTATYLCTDVITKSESKKWNDWTLPFTTKSLAIRYDGTVKAGIRDLTQAEVTEESAEDGRSTITIILPDVEITGVELDKDSFEKIEEKDTIFNKFTFDDFNTAQKELEEEMEQQAIEKGILEMAKANAETVITGMLESTDFDLQVKWASE